MMRTRKKFVHCMPLNFLRFALDTKRIAVIQEHFLARKETMREDRTRTSITWKNACAQRNKTANKDSHIIISIITSINSQGDAHHIMDLQLTIMAKSPKPIDTSPPNSNLAEKKQRQQFSHQ